MNIREIMQAMGSGHAEIVRSSLITIAHGSADGRPPRLTFAVPDTEIRRVKGKPAKDADLYVVIRINGDARRAAAAGLVLPGVGR